MNDPKPNWTALEPNAGHSMSRPVFDYHYLRRRLVELHSAEPKNTVAIDTVMRKLDELRGAVHTEPRPFGREAPAHAAVPAHR